MQPTVVLYRSPLSRLRCGDDLLRFMQLIGRWCHAPNNLRDLIRVNAPHPEEPELMSRSVRILKRLVRISNVHGDVVIRDLVVT